MLIAGALLCLYAQPQWLDLGVFNWIRIQRLVTHDAAGSGEEKEKDLQRATMPPPCVIGY